MLKLTNYPINSEISDDFAITLNNIKANAIKTRVSAMPFNRSWPGKQRPLNQTEIASYISFESDSDVTICLTPKKSFKKVTIRPLSKEILPEIKDGKITFSVKCPGQYTVELDTPHNALHIFADFSADFNLNQDDNLIYFGAGTHDIGDTELKSNTTVYIDRDAVVYGSFYAIDAQNIRITGHGVLDGSKYERQTDNFLVVYDFMRVPPESWEYVQMKDIFKGHEHLFPNTKGYIKGNGTDIFKNREQLLELMNIMKPVKTGLKFYKCKNIKVEGIIIRDCAGLSVIQMGCEDVHYDSVKLVGMWRYNSDGINFYNCQNCSVKNSFLRTFDDSICVKGQVGFDTEPSSDISVENCVIWNDWGKSLEIGVDTVAPEICNVTFKNCDVIHSTGVPIDVSNMDRANIHNIVYDDIRLEFSKHDFKPQSQSNDDTQFIPTLKSPTPIKVFMDCGMWSVDKIPGKISDVTFNNIKITSDYDSKLNLSFNGIDNEHNASDITLNNITLNGRKLAENDFNISTTQFAEYKIC